MADQLNHAEAEELIALAALGVLPATEGAELDSHLHGCAQCRETARTFTRSAAVLPEALDLLAPPATLRRRLLAEVYGGAVPEAKKSQRLRGLWMGIPQNRGFTVLAAAAAIAAVIIGVVAARGGGPSAPRTFAVMATTVAPAVHGDLTFYPATASYVVSVSGLPEQPARAAPVVFELWLIPHTGPPQAAAYLTATPDGTTWTAAAHANLLDYKAVAATGESGAGHAQPGGAQLFSVTLSASG